MEKDYRSFLHQLLTAGKEERGYSLSGSAAEMPIRYSLFDFTDLDLMTFPRDRCAISTEDFRPEDFNGTVYFIENIPECPGYAKLRITGRQYLKRDEFLKKRFSSQGPSYEDGISVSSRWTNDERKTSTFYAAVRSGVILVDYVQCIVSPQWPLQANEWVTRKRNNGWPSKDTIARVVDDGCHLVRKSHPNCSDDDEMFRFSFSKAEIILIRTWNSNQTYIYHLIRQVKRQLALKWKQEDYKSALCTYFFKTLMLWACERKSKKFWNEQDFKSSLQELLFEMVEWLIERRCPHYFIPEYNMMDHLQAPEFDFEKEINDILEVSNSFGFPIIIMKTPNSYLNIKLSIPFPKKCLVLMQLMYFHSVKYLRTSNREWLRSSSTSDPCTYSPLIREEFRDLYLGISEHYRFVTSRFHNDLFLSRASLHFNRAVMDDRHCSIVEFNLGDTFTDMLEGIHFVSGPNHCKNGLTSCWKNEKRNQKNVVTSEGVSDSLSFQQRHAMKTEAMISVMEDAVFTPRSAPESKFKLFDLLRPSFGVSAAYLANFHYCTRRDYDLSIRICEAASTMLANNFVECSGQTPTERNPHAMILNNKLIVLFDQEIQTVFGFVVLVKGLQLNGCRAFSKEAHMSKFSGQQDVGSCIFCRLNPLDFLNYVHYRCELQKIALDRKQVPAKKHELPNHPDFSFDSWSMILSAATRISSLLCVSLTVRNEHGNRMKHCFANNVVNNITNLN